MAKMGRLSPSVLESDVSAQDAIEEMTDFAPVNEAYKATALDALKQVMITKQAAEASAQRVAQAARDDAAEAERAYHEAIVGAKLAVKAQYGKDSNEVQAVGLKKSSEIVRGRRRTVASKNF